MVLSTTAGNRPGLPQDPNEWISDDVWHLISQCWRPFRDDRPDVGFLMDTLSDAAVAIEVRRRESRAVKIQGEITSCGETGASYRR